MAFFFMAFFFMAFFCMAFFLLLLPRLAGKDSTAVHREDATGIPARFGHAASS